MSTIILQTSSALLSPNSASMCGYHPAWPILHPVLSSFLWCAGLLAVTLPLMLWRYRVRTTG